MERLNLRKILARVRGKGSVSTAGQKQRGPLEQRHRTRRLWSLAIVLVVLAGLALAAAGGLSKQSMGVVGLLGAMQPDAFSVPATDGTVRGMTSGYAPPAAEAQLSSPAIGGSSQPANPGWDRMIIRTATLQLQVKDVTPSLDEVRGLAGAHGGYVSQSESRLEGEYTVATITLQVPVREFDSVISKLRKVGIKVLGENVSSSDVTEEYTDLQSQLRNLQATEQRMIALMQKAERIEDILTLDREMRQIQGEIERAQGRINFLGKRAEMSTITVSLHPQAAPVAVQTKTVEGWDPVQVAVRSWNASLELLSGVVSALISVVVFMWWAIPLLLLAAWLARRPRRQAVVPPAPSAEA